MSSTPNTPEPEDLASGWNRLRSERLNSYEMVALELFAARGFDNVSVDDIAHEVGVSSRTLYRYFPTKEDFLLGYVRRNVYAVAAAISALPISDSPLEAVWDTINSYLVEELDGVRVMNLWRAAARTAPNVTAAAVGERALVLIEELNDYFAKCWNTDADTDPNPRLAAGMIVGIELASVLASGRTDMRRKNFDAAMRFTTSGIELASKKRARRT